MLTRKLSRPLLMILLSGFTLGQTSCQTVQILPRTACFVNGMISLGSTCANTLTSKTSQLTTQESLDVLESRPAIDGKPAHPPGVYQSADDYGEETVELETACRLLGNDCTYELKTTIENRKALVKLRDEDQ